MFTLFIAVFVVFGFEKPSYALGSLNSGKLCADSFVRDSSSKYLFRFIKKINSKFPHIYLDPIPRIVSKIDNAEVDRLVEVYLNYFQLGDFSKLSSQLTTNEKKIAYLEAYEKFIRSRISEMGGKLAIKKIRIERESNLIKYVSKWKNGTPITKRIFKEIIDLLYLSNHSSFFIANGFRADQFLDNPKLLALARSRWETQILEMESFILTTDITNPGESKRGAIYEFSKKTLSWASFLGVNYISLQILYFPSIYPRFSIFELPIIRSRVRKLLETDFLEGYYSFINAYGGILKYERYNRWLNKIFPYMLSAVILAHGAVDYIQNKNFVHEPFGVVKIENLETREAIEKAVLEIMISKYEEEFGFAPNPEKIGRFNDEIFKMTIKQLDSFRTGDRETSRFD